MEIVDKVASHTVTVRHPSMSFVKVVCTAMERLAPLRLAESWDNVGLLLEAPVPRPGNKVLLTIDLTPKVLQEALESKTSVIVSYHPPIFKPLSALTLGNPLQASLLRCAHAGISVYCPHTALDSVKGGINDWLSEAFESRVNVEYIESKGDDLGGAGRKVTLRDPGLTIGEVVYNVKRSLQIDPGINPVQVAFPLARYDRRIKSIAVCAGGGGSMLKDVDCDLYFTGEMSHHEVLAAQAQDRFVLLCGHTNTERGYLKILADRLHKDLQSNDLSLKDVDIAVSQKDTHPLISM